MELTLGDLQQIELILLEASAWGLRTEVEITAEQYIKEGIDSVTAYNYAYNEWIK